MATRSNDWRRILLFALAIAVGLGTLVSTVSVWLAPRQAENAGGKRRAALESLLACDPSLTAILEDTMGNAAGALDAWVVDLETGCRLPGIDASCFDVEAAAAAPKGHLDLSPEDDLAEIGERPHRVVIYEVRDESALCLLVLPVEGQGYQSRLEGFLSLAGDLETVSSLVFHSHNETPGMGARIGDPEWQATWRGKRIRDGAGRPRIGVRLRDAAEPSPYEVDAMSGATRTGQGVTNLLRFWLGDLGYGRLLRNLRNDAPCVRVPDRDA